ncbi:uncharacterized protein LOC119833736 [Zerene cesonia]|uniref:uncharacterized protein LOC119833736 n=1 Tax=Zerene cesonia TaxID=33412 RepID=UPI0018E5365B|nr:uncharacterized protein LOC119833736 [Zerene cesonia]
MSVSVRIVASFLLISAITAVPVKEKSEKIDEFTGDLEAESSEIISEAVAPPASLSHFSPRNRAPAVGHGDHSIEIVSDSQTFFPTFANFFEPKPQQNNFRFGFGNQEAAFSQRPNSYRSLLNSPLFGGYRAIDNFSKQNTPASEPLVDASSSVLGSGNFGIIRGGTFFTQNDEGSDFGDGLSYYNNGHGRPSLNLGYIANPRPNYNHDQFANFKDFADINTPSNSDYSHYVVVYANKNATLDEISEETKQVVYRPKNIFETLEQIDTTVAPKVSKSKAKLAVTKQKMQNKKEKWNKSSKLSSVKHDPEEPLLALS